MTLKNFGLFALAGGIAFFVDAGILVASEPLIGAFGGRIVSFSAAVATTWVINRNFAFRDRQASGTLTGEFARYFAAMLPGAVANWLAYGVAAMVMPHTPVGLTLAVAGGSVAGMVVNFVLADKLVYRQRR